MRTLIANTQWGELTKSETGERIKDDFIGDFKDFCEFLSSKRIPCDFCIFSHVRNAFLLSFKKRYPISVSLSLVTKIDLENIMRFQVNWDFYQKNLMQPENIIENIHNPDVIIAAEANVQMWMKTMERVRFLLIIISLTSISQQIRFI